MKTQQKIVIPTAGRDLLSSASNTLSRFATNGSRIRAAALLGGIFTAILLLASFHLRSVQASADQTTPASPLVSILHIDGDVEPILATYLDEGLTDAAQRHAALVVITMDTPGGLSDSMKEIVQHILASPVPVAVYVTPEWRARRQRRLLHFALRGRRRHGSRHAHRCRLSDHGDRRPANSNR